MLSWAIHGDVSVALAPLEKDFLLIACDARFCELIDACVLGYLIPWGRGVV